MKNKGLLTASLALMMALPMQAQKFEDNFEDKTLRLDYIVAGDSVKQAIYFEQAYSNPTWAGRKTRLDEKFLNGNGQSYFLKVTICLFRGFFLFILLLFLVIFL